jgi:hypothetical protein
MHRRLHHILQNGQMRPQREVLEHHADAPAHRRQVAVAHHDAAIGDADLLPIEKNAPVVGPLEPVDAAQERRFV